MFASSLDPNQTTLKNYKKNHYQGMAIVNEQKKENQAGKKETKKMSTQKPKERKSLVLNEKILGKRDKP